MNEMWLWFPLLGIPVGVLAGLLGIGGGLVLVSALVFVLPRFGVGDEALMHVALATSLGSIVCTSLASTWLHHRRGAVLWPMVAWLVPGMLLGGVLGARVAVDIPGDWLRGGVATYCLLMAAQLWTQWPRPREPREPLPGTWRHSVVGTGIGVLSAWVGIGGGSMTAPWLMWNGATAVRAIASASACGVFIGLATALTYALQAPAQSLGAGFVGHVFVPAALGIAATSILSARIGVQLAHRLPAATLRGVFAVFLVLMGVGLFLS